MKTKNASRIQTTVDASRSFVNELRQDQKFCMDAKRIGLIGLAALLLSAGMFALARSGLVYDVNALEVVVFTSIASAIVSAYAVISLAVRVMNEFSSYIVDHLE